MRFIVIIAATAAFAVPTLGQEGCSYVSGFDLGRIVETGDGSATFVDTDGSEHACEIMWGDEAGNTINCDNFGVKQFALVASRPDSTDRDLLILDNGPWYRNCD